MPYERGVFQGTLSFVPSMENILLAEIYTHVHYAMPGNCAIDNPPLGMIGFLTYVLQHFLQLPLAPFLSDVLSIASCVYHR